MASKTDEYEIITWFEGGHPSVCYIGHCTDEEASAVVASLREKAHPDYRILPCLKRETGLALEAAYQHGAVRNWRTS